MLRILADMGVSKTSLEMVRQAGFDADHLRDRDLQTLPDADIVSMARQERRVIVTFDLDFADLRALSAEPLPSVILFRLRRHEPAWVGLRLVEILRSETNSLSAGAFVSVRDNGYRVRNLPIR